MTIFLETYAYCALAVMVYVSLAFIVSRALGRRNDFVDIAWGGGFIVIAWLSFLLNNRLQDMSSPA